MKKIVCYVLLFVLPFIAAAQAFQGGLLLGVVGSQVAGDMYSGFNKVGFTAGGYVNLKLSQRYKVQLEMEYIQKGSRHNSDPNQGDLIDYRLNVNYIEVPLLLRYDLMERISAEAGLGMAFLVSHKETINGYDMSKGATTPGFRSSNLSIMGGVSYSFYERYCIGFRADSSVLTMRKGSGTGFVRRFTNDWGQFHDLLVFSLYYKL
ncbi:MAG: porin family protein [Bacteroidetes bacterium]|nr:porin family protein [Bacteroidota bacterium]